MRRCNSFAALSQLLQRPSQRPAPCSGSAPCASRRCCATASTPGTGELRRTDERHDERRDGRYDERRDGRRDEGILLSVFHIDELLYLYL